MVRLYRTLSTSYWGGRILEGLRQNQTAMCKVAAGSQYHLRVVLESDDTL